MDAGKSPGAVLNGLCPYFTMFPLSFPLGILQRRSRPGHAVLDPFCGRGTTNFAARLLGLTSLGVDSSPVATAVTAAKLVSASPASILNVLDRILGSEIVHQVPQGEFWEWAFDAEVLHTLSKLRQALIRDCRSSARVALRGIVLGALHGPRQKFVPSYFSNQSPRTFAPKPGYAVRFWKAHRQKPQQIDVRKVIVHRAHRFYGCAVPRVDSHVSLADSRDKAALDPATARRRFNWVVTSPPYYGMKTYVPDQWLRNWFVGGPSNVDYTLSGQLTHSGPDEFARDLRSVWVNAWGACAAGARLVIRFGGIRDRNVEPLELLKESLTQSGWKIETVRSAGNAQDGRRQAHSFLRVRTNPVLEYDVWARK